MADKPELEPCPFCGATPHRGLGKVERCQSHGEPFQRFSVRCPHGHANITAMNEEQAYSDWNTRATASQPDASALVEAVRRAAKNAEPKHGEVSLHATDWLALMDALSAWEAQHG